MKKLKKLLLTVALGLHLGLMHADELASDSETEFYIKGDFLYWIPHVEGLELNFGTSEITETVSNCVYTYRMKEFDTDPHFKWNAGYRLAMGYRAACDGIGIDAFWTHFQGHASRSNSEIDLSTSKWRLKFDQVDLILAQCESLCSCLIVRPFFGVRAAKIHENLKGSLTTSITTPTGPAQETRTADDKQTFSGIGPFLGFRGLWDLGCGLGLRGLAATGVLYGNYRLHFNDSDVFSAPFSKSAFYKQTSHVHAFICNLDLAFGVQWQTCLLECVDLILSLSFEHHQYFNLNRLGQHHGDLCLDGGVFSLSLLF